MQPDILVGGGDYVFGSRDRFAEATSWMRLLQPRLAFIGVLGNHDYWHGSEQAEKACAAGGMLLLNNERLFIDENRKICFTAPRRGLCLAGVGDLWSFPVDIDKALAGVEEAMPRLLFSHNPAKTLAILLSAIYRRKLDKRPHLCASRDPKRQRSQL